MVNIDEWLSRAMECKSLSAAEVKDLCLICREFLLEESNVQPVRSPVTVCGDIHGQFYDLVELLRVGGDVSMTNYIFMGDFVDRGYYSLETLTLLLVLKVKFPSKMTLLRGNHESRQITHIYGFYDECRNKYGSPDAWKDFTMLFDYLTLAAIIDGEVLCIHGGLSPDIQTLDQVRTIPRMQEVPNSGPFSDLLWSDPDDRITGWRTSTRGAGFVFGSMVAQQFTEINGLNLICRAHQLVQQGFQYHFPAQSVVTVWSAPNYCYRCGNVAAVLAFDEHLGREFHTFSAVPNDRRQVPSPKEVAYFL